MTKKAVPSAVVIDGPPVPVTVPPMSIRQYIIVQTAVALRVKYWDQPTLWVLDRAEELADAILERERKRNG